MGPELSDIDEERKQQIAPYQWKKGAGSPNPSGRHRTEPVVYALRSILDSPVPEVLRKRLNRMTGRNRVEIPEGSTFGEVLALRLAVRAMFDNSALKLLLSYTAGRPPASIHHFTARVEMEMQSEMNTAYDRLVKMFSTGDEQSQLPEGSPESQPDTIELATDPEPQNPE